MLIYKAVAAVGLIVTSLWAATASMLRDDPPPATQPAVDPAEMLAAAVEIGFTPEAVAACGLGESISDMLETLAEADELRETLASKRTDLSAAASNAVRLQAALSASPGNSELRSDYETARALEASIRQDIASAQEALYAEVTDGLSGPDVAKWSIYNTTRGMRVPAEFRVADRSELDWRRIGRAVVAERRAARLGQELNPEQAALLAAIRAEQAVVQAASDLAGDLANVEAAFEAVAHPPVIEQ